AGHAGHPPATPGFADDVRTMGLGDFLLGYGLSIAVPDDRLPGPDVVGADGLPLPPAVAALDILLHGAGGDDGSLRVTENRPELAYVFRARVVPEVLQRPRIAADPDLGQRTTLVVADQPVDGLIDRSTRRLRLRGRGRLGLGPIEILCRRILRFRPR